MRFLITGGAGFIGSALIRYLILETNHCVINLDKLTYSGNLDSLSMVDENSRYKFVHGDISDSNLMRKTFQEYQPDIVMHLAAESHVDRSIDAPAEFIQTNIVGTYVLLETARAYWEGLDLDARNRFKFHHISTDEVYGSLGHEGLFTEATAYDPSSPYSASKASSDHLVRAWNRTYGMPTLISNCSNNYGPYQFVEKLIPLMILNALDGKSMPVYGNGQQVRDWLYVDDHVRALVCVATQGKTGQTYNIGGYNEKSNIEVVHTICEYLNNIRPMVSNQIDDYRSLIEYVEDRPGHDLRYAIDATKISNELNWRPKETFETGIKKTIHWYLENTEWCKKISGGYIHSQRLGVRSKQGVKE